MGVQAIARGTCSEQAGRAGPRRPTTQTSCFTARMGEALQQANSFHTGQSHEFSAPRVQPLRAYGVLSACVALNVAAGSCCISLIACSKADPASCMSCRTRSYPYAGACKMSRSWPACTQAWSRQGAGCHLARPCASSRCALLQHCSTLIPQCLLHLSRQVADMWAGKG